MGIERMVAEAEEYAEEDKKVKEKIDARNELESQIYSVKGAVAEKEKWEGKNQEAEKDDFVDKKTDFVEKTREIMTKLQNAKGDDEEKSDDEGKSDDDEDEL